MSRLHEGPAAVAPTFATAGVGEVTWDLTFSRHTEDRIEELARIIKGTPEDVLKLSLALFSLAVESKIEGKRIAIVDQEGHVDKEITGF